MYCKTYFHNHKGQQDTDWSRPVVFGRLVLRHIQQDDNNQLRTNFTHQLGQVVNSKVIKQESGEFIPARRPGGNGTDFNLAKHRSHTAADGKLPQRMGKREAGLRSSMFLSQTPQPTASKLLQEEVINRLKRDEIGNTVRGDALLIA
jgi:hypothetical protein